MIYNNLLLNIDKVHTTELGVCRIKKNLKLDIDCDVVLFLKNLICNEKCYVYKNGKNLYCEVKNIRLTINSYSYTIITAHFM